MSTPDPEEGTEAPAPKKKRWGRRILFAIIGLVILAGGGGGGYWWYTSRAAAASSNEKKKPEPAPTRVLPMDPFVVNLADGGGTRFLRVNLSLVVEDNESAREMVEMAVVRALR